MLKRILPAFFLLGFFLLIQNAAGQEKTGMHIHGSIGLSSMTEKSFDSGFWSGFGFSVPVSKDTHLAFSFGAWRSQISTKPGGLQNGSLTVNPFFVSLYYFLASDRSIFPYLFIGGGYIFSSFRMGDIVTIPEITLSQKVSNSPGGEAGAGIQLKVSEQVFLSADVSFLYSKTSGTTTIQDLNFGTTTEDFSLVLSTLVFRLGIKFFI